MNIAITGANGFIGSHLKNFIGNLKNINLILIVRNKENSNDYNQLTYQDFFEARSTIKIDLFIHLASPNVDYARDNLIKEGIAGLTNNILKVLSKYSCSKFIFFSSGKVYGESSLKNFIFDETSELNPVTDYAKSKLIAEELIKEASIKKEINYLIYRLPFVYGTGMKSNIGLLLKCIERSIPIFILKNENNLKKSFLSIGNIKKMILHNISHNSSIDNQVINISDAEPISLTKFIRLYKEETNSKSILIPLNSFIFKLLTKTPLLGKFFIKVYGNFQLENKKIKNILKEDIITTERGIINYINDQQ
tara:strand:+ start:3516 stop:4436 length:921 start_codon:yes stop_codon:yes gene_type:complete